jgi:molecular chaperone DnaK
MSGADLSNSGPIVGIDLGTTNSAVAIVIDGKPVAIKVDQQNWMPSVVGLDANGNLLTGIVAKNQLAAFPDKTISSIKRKMGTEEKVSMGGQVFTPPEISAMILRRLKDVASRHLGREVNRAVITVPAYFNEHQRQATRQAGELAGLKVERIINEPTAASLVYHVAEDKRQNIAVYDFGGGTFDVSIVRMESGVIEVLSSHGDTKLGGDDIDHLLLDFVADGFKKQHGVDFRAEPQARFRVLQACENAKIALSEVESVEIAEEFIGEKNGTPLHLRLSLSREELNAMIMPLIEKTLSCLGKALVDASLTIQQLDDLVLVGGSTRIPLIADMLRQQYRGEPSRSVDPDLAVALGAAVQAAMLQGENVGPVLVDVSTLTLGLEAVVGETPSGPALAVIPIIHRGSALPARYEQPFLKMYSEQERVEGRIFQGEDPDPDANVHIGTISLDLEKGGGAASKIVVGFQLTLDGVLRVTAKQPSSGRFEEIRIDNALSAMSSDEKAASRSRLISLFAPSSEWDGTTVDADATSIDTVSRTDSRHASLDKPHEQILEAAKVQYPKAVALLDQAEKIKQRIQGDDMEEFRSLQERLVEALASGDSSLVYDLTADLDDLLFYVQ